MKQVLQSQLAPVWDLSDLPDACYTVPLGGKRILSKPHSTA
jgi:hypothetical protein